MLFSCIWLYFRGLQYGYVSILCFSVFFQLTKTKSMVQNASMEVKSAELSSLMKAGSATEPESSTSGDDATFVIDAGVDAQSTSLVKAEVEISPGSDIIALSKTLDEQDAQMLGKLDRDNAGRTNRVI